MSLKIKEVIYAGTCYKCGERVEGKGVHDQIKDCITQKIKYVYFHPRCFKPLVNEPVLIEVDFSNELKKHLESWNEQFNVPDIESLIRHGQNYSIYIENKRAWIEIFKYFCPEELIRIGNICKKFYVISRNTEVMSQVFCNSQNTSYDIVKEYVTNKFLSCVQCKRIEYMMFCNMIKRSFCHNCYRNRYVFKGINKKFDLRIVHDLMSQYNVTWDFFDNIPLCFDFNFRYRTYPYLVERKLEKNDSEASSSPRKKQKLVKI